MPRMIRAFSKNEGGRKKEKGSGFFEKYEFKFGAVLAK
jgi:hypothetical protein